MSQTPTHTARPTPWRSDPEGSGDRPPARARTVWEEGSLRGRVVVTAAVVAALALAALNAGLVSELSLFFDLSFVVVCLVAALAVRPGDFFPVGVLPPLLMLVVVALAALLAPDLVAQPTDGVVQAVVTGLALHSGALVTGHGVVLVLLGLRQVALRNAGRLRTPA